MALLLQELEDLVGQYNFRQSQGKRFTLVVTVAGEDHLIPLVARIITATLDFQLHLAQIYIIWDMAVVVVGLRMPSLAMVVMVELVAVFLVIIVLVVQMVIIRMVVMVVMVMQHLAAL
jgi:hypothetical protein